MKRDTRSASQQNESSIHHYNGRGGAVGGGGEEKREGRKEEGMMGKRGLRGGGKEAVGQEGTAFRGGRRI